MGLLGAARSLQAVLLITITILLRGAGAGYDEYEDLSDWGYADDNGPCAWKNKYPCCKGHRQSPLSLHRKGAQTVCGPMLQWKCYDNLPCVITLINNGRTVMARGAWDCKEPPSVKLGNCTYEFENLHFHWGSTNDTGSEHSINGEKFPLEMQIVHTKKPRLTKRSVRSPLQNFKRSFAHKTRPGRRTDDHELLIIVILFKICNADPNELHTLKKLPCPCLTRPERSPKRQYYEMEDDPDQLKGNVRIDNENQSHDSEDHNNEDGSRRRKHKGKSTSHSDDNDHPSEEEGEHLQKETILKTSENIKHTPDRENCLNNENESVSSGSHKSLTKATGKRMHKKKPVSHTVQNVDSTQDNDEDKKKEPAALITEVEKQPNEDDETSLEKDKSYNASENTRHSGHKSVNHLNQVTPSITIDNKHSIHQDEKCLVKDTYLLSSENSKEPTPVNETEMKKKHHSKNSDDSTELQPENGKSVHEKKPTPSDDDNSPLSNDDNEVQKDIPNSDENTLEDEERNVPKEKEPSNVSGKGNEDSGNTCNDIGDEDSDPMAEKNYNPKQKQTCLADLWKEFCKVKSAGSTVNIKPIPMSKIIPEFTRDFFLYKGSISSPPCTENALYVVSNKILCIDYYQLEPFRTLMSDGNCPLVDNYRPAQKRSRRPINYITLKRPKPTCTAPADECTTTSMKPPSSSPGTTKCGMRKREHKGRTSSFKDNTPRP